MAEGTPLIRSGRAGLARNAVLVAAARLVRGAPDAEVTDARAAIAAGLAHDDASVREVAGWAVQRAASASLRQEGSSLESVEAKDEPEGWSPTRRGD